MRETNFKNIKAETTLALKRINEKLHSRYNENYISGISDALIPLVSKLSGNYVDANGDTKTVKDVGTPEEKKTGIAGKVKNIDPTLTEAAEVTRKLFNEKVREVLTNKSSIS